MNRRLFLSLAVILFTFSSLAATFRVPSDRELVRHADAIVEATVRSQQSWFGADGEIRTTFFLDVSGVLKGEISETSQLEVVQLGGVVGDQAMMISSSASFVTGESVLLFLWKSQEGWTPLGGALGKFSLVRDAGGEQILTRVAFDGEIQGWDVYGQRHDEKARAREPFLTFIRSVVNQDDEGGDEALYSREWPGQEHAKTIVENNHVSPHAYLSKFDTRGGRWPAGGFSMKTNGVQSGVPNLAAATAAAAGAWNGDPGSSIGISVAGTSTGAYPVDDNENVIVLNHPDSGPLLGSVVGEATIRASFAAHTFNGTEFLTMNECDIAMQSTLSGALFQEVLAHEMGHCLGFRHSNTEAPSSNVALMKPAATGAGAILQAWDREAANHVYGDGTVGAPGCTAPAITSQPASTSIPSGSTATLSVGASGTAPLAFQWFQGGTPTSGSAIAGATSSSFTTPALTSTTTYSVRVTNSCGTADSNVATVSISCPVPAITQHPQSRSVNAGESVTLSVAASNAVSFQWFRGLRGDTSSPAAGATSTSFNTGPINATSRFWVRVTNSCGSSDSLTATLSLCTAPVISRQPTGATVESGQSAALSVVVGGTGPISYQWFRGNSGNTSSTVGGATSSNLNTGALTADTSFWVRAIGACGSVNSQSVLVRVTSSCQAPAITVQPSGTSIQTGEIATMAVTATGTALQYQWFQGESGNQAQPVGGATGSSLTTPPLSATTPFWVRISNNCGSANSVTVTVSVGCNVQVLQQPSNIELPSGWQATIGIIASGPPPLTYQWYEGESGDTSRPVAGATSPLLVTRPITSVTKFWVRVTSPCGTVDSTASTLTNPVRPRMRAARR